jgi:hypothetical protein
MSLQLTAPQTVLAQAPAMNQEVWPFSSQVDYVFPGTKYTQGQTIRVTWYDGVGAFPPKEKLNLPEDAKLPAAGSVLIGEAGSLVIPHVAAPQLYPREKFAEFKIPVVPARDHYVSWADACRGEGETTSLFKYSGPLTEAVLLGTIAERVPGETLQWNAADMKFGNSHAASHWLTKHYRTGWELPA